MKEAINCYYGKSMYGGWYLESVDYTMNIHINTKTLREVKEYAMNNNLILDERKDN